MPDWKFGYHANCWGSLGGHPVGVTSIKDLFYKTFGDMPAAFSDIGRAGYAGVELFDGNLLDYEGRIPVLKEQLARAGLTLVAAYSGGNFIFPDVMAEEFWRIEKASVLAAEAGARHLVVGGGAKRSTGSTEDDYKRLGDALEKVVDVTARHGLTAHYHPHLTTMAETPEQVRKVFARTSIRFCPDTAHLAAAGGDPAAMIEEHYDRISYVHLKGWQRMPFAFTPLDTGDLAMDPIVDVLVRRKFSGWITVELDSWADPAGGAARSLAYLKRKLPR